ncbi:MAG: helix-turn-helix domain-containing protein [Methanomicrobiaceae archaeon]|nr:helix-turn-helix domain-containing protein [Methanomicrobiaceae archaeon]
MAPQNNHQDPPKKDSNKKAASSPGEEYLKALGRRRSSRSHRIFSDQNFYAIPEVAERLKITEELVRELIRRGELHAYRIGKAYRITDDDIDAFLESCSTGHERP